MDEIRPEYYKDPSGKECIDYMIDNFGIDAVIHFCRVNAYKYRFRAGKKPKEAKEKDITKAIFYERKAVALAARKEESYE